MLFNNGKKSNVSEKFTKSDLKNGDIVISRTGTVAICIADLGVFVYRDGWDDFKDINEDLTDIDGDSNFDIVKVIRPTEPWHCQFFRDKKEYDKIGNVVYERITEPEKQLYNGKVVCIDNVGNKSHYTIGKIYQFNNGTLITDKGWTFPTRRIYSFDEWTTWTSSKFIEIKE